MTRLIQQPSMQRQRWLNLGRIVQSLELVQDLIIINHVEILQKYEL